MGMGRVKYPKEKRKMKASHMDKDLIVFALSVVWYKRKLDHLVFLPHASHDKTASKLQQKLFLLMLMLIGSARVIEHRTHSQTTKELRTHSKKMCELASPKTPEQKRM